MPLADLRRTTVVTPTLAIACEESGPPDGAPVVLLHGFPYDPRCFDEVAPRLAAAGHRVIAPYLRGFGDTRFLRPGVPRSGEQAALARDLVDLMDALDIASAALMGFDWGGRAACIAAALWPERVRRLVTGGGYNIQDIALSGRPQPPGDEHRLWYQYYFHAERGRAGLAEDRRALCRLLWDLWSPSWAEGAALFGATAPSFDNPDFVEVVIHSYRHRFGLVPGDPAVADVERRIAALPPITVPTVSLCGADDGVEPPAAGDPDVKRFTGPYRRRLLAGIGHNIPGEAPGAVVEALLEPVVA